MGLKDWFNKGKQGNEESSGDEGGKVVPLRDIEVQVSGFGVGGSVKHNQKSGIEDVTDAVSQLYRKGVEDGRDAGRMAGQVEGFVVGHDGSSGLVVKQRGLLIASLERCIQKPCWIRIS
jgi:hypothetical protein